MDLFPKFIIEDGNLILGKVTYHSELVTDKTKIKGGGWFRLKFKEKTITFYGYSHDYGKATLEDVRNCIISGKVYTSKYHTKSPREFKYFYDTGTEIIELLLT